MFISYGYEVVAIIIKSGGKRIEEKNNYRFEMRFGDTLSDL